MAYKKESITKLIVKANGLKREFMAVITDLHVCISKGNRKIGKVMNVSMMPILTCHNCKECKHLCYDIKACLQYSNTVLPARMRNTVLAMHDRDRYFSEINDACTRRRKNKYFRWHVAGDILDMDYFERMLDICCNHPDFVFWTYTKYYDIVNEYCDMHGRDAIPANFSIMFSEWDGMPMNNPYNFPVFSCKLKGGNKNRTEAEFKKMYKCCGNCDICKRDGGHGCIKGENTYCDEH